MVDETEEMMKEDVKKRRKEEWIEAWFAIEALGATQDVVKTSLEKHMKNLSGTKNVLVYEKKFSEIKKVDNPPKDLKEAYSQVVEAKLFAKDLATFLIVVMLYGPSSIEVIGPTKKEIKINELQEIANAVSGIMHEFAAAGLGGLVITPK